MSETVCAVVVTYNRKELLIECLDAICKQTRPVQGICIIDNASNNDTPTLLLEKGYIKELPPVQLFEPWEKEFQVQSLTDDTEPVSIKIHYVRMHENTGGAGGFHEGVKKGYEEGYDWLWLMDDDVVPFDSAVENLFSAKTKLQTGDLYFCSNVFDSSGEQILNVPNLDSRKHFQGDPSWNKHLDKGVVKITSATFVSCLIPRQAIRECGLPIKDFFIWCDDSEFTQRLTSAGYQGYLVGASKVKHMRVGDAGLDIIAEIAPSRIRLYFYFYRNNLYLLKHNDLGKLKKILFFYRILKDFMNLFSTTHPWLKARTIIKALIQYPTFKPDIEFPTQSSS